MTRTMNNALLITKGIVSGGLIVAISELATPRSSGST
jgi:hypothetical protein